MSQQNLSDLHVLIMAGGSGTRFWPRSRRKRPKQLLALWDDKALIEHTLDRLSKLVPTENFWIVTTESLETTTRKVLGKNFENVKFILEPIGKNTAPCILWGCLEIQKTNPKAVIAVIPADSFVEDEGAYREALITAYEQAKKENGLVTLGIRPDRPETGYGYIEIEPSSSRTKTSSQPVPAKRFVEKPDLQTAARYVESGRYLWNAGMFIFRASIGELAFQKSMPDLFSLLKSKDRAEQYAKIPPKDAISFDYGVMESAAEHGISVWVVPTSCGWNDVGSFRALEDINHAIRGSVVTVDSVCNVVQTDTGIVALLGVNDMVVVRDGDVVLVCPKDRSQDIKLLLEKIRLRFDESSSIF